MTVDSGQIRTGFLGDTRTRSLLVLGIAGALFLSVYFLSIVAERQGWMSAIDGQIHFVVLFVLVVGGGLAAGNASWNDGLGLSWLLVFALVFGWLWNVFVQEGPVFFDEAIVPLAWAVFTALVVGTVGYVIGRSFHGLPTQDTESDPSGWLLWLLVGQDPVRPVRWSLLAGGLFVIASSMMYVTQPYLPLPVEGVTLFELFYPTGVLAADTLPGAIVVLGWMGVAMWPAYRNAGLLVSWGLLFGPMFGASLTDFVLDGISGSGPFVDATFAFLAALIFALILGTGGFLIGRALRWAFDRRRPTEEQSLRS